MKPINEYLLSKKHAKANTGFLDINEGDVRTKQDVIDFFKKKKFKRVDASFLPYFYDEFENSNQLVYWVGKFSTPHDSSNWVRFGKGGKISETNPVMFWRVNDYSKNNYAAIDYSYATSKNTSDAIHQINTWEEFKDFVNKIFENE